MRTLGGAGRLRRLLRLRLGGGWAVARWHQEETFPGPLAEFAAEDWPPVEGECLGHYACRGEGYEAACAPRPGEFCGQACYESLARDFPDR
jgi:hypothetical protein